MSRHKVTRREFDSILAGLRLSMHDSAWIADGDGMIRAIAEEHGDALTNEEIDALCQKLNLDGESNQSGLLEAAEALLEFLERWPHPFSIDISGVQYDLQQAIAVAKQRVEPTPTQQKAIGYLLGRGACCPHCGGSIEGGSMNFESGEICQRITCTDCGERWNDIYKLTAVTTEDGELIASISIPEEKQ